MFRDGQYLEIIKISDKCLGAAIVTVQEKTILIKKRKVSTNKWLTLEDWSMVYKVLKKALLQNVKNGKPFGKVKECEQKICTGQIEITYTFENAEELEDKTIMPTIRVKISPTRKRMQRSQPYDTKLVTEKCLDKSDQQSDICVKKGTLRSIKSETVTSINNSNHITEEYVPDVSQLKNDVKYVPSKKSTLKAIQLPMDEYTPASLNNKHFIHNIHYIPNNVATLNLEDNAYEPTSITVGSSTRSKEYVPNSKNSSHPLEEYQPDFKCKSMKFDKSYVPSNLHVSKEELDISEIKIKNVEAQNNQHKSQKCRKKSTGGQLKNVKRKL